MKLAICHMHAIVDRVAYARPKTWPTGMPHPPVEHNCIPLGHTLVATEQVEVEVSCSSGAVKLITRKHART